MHKSLTPTAANGLFEQAPFGYLLIGSDLIIRSANRKAASLLGLSSEQLRQTPMGEFIGSADRQNFETLCSDVVNTGKNRSADLQVRSRNGDMRFVHLHCKPAGAAGQFDEDAGLLVGLIDITERKTSETRLTSERDNLAGILNAMEDGVYIVNNDHEIEYINQALQKQFGPIRNRKCYQYFHNRQSACPWCKNQAVFSGQTVRWDWYSDKTDRTYNLVDTPLKKSDGSILKLEIFRDITDRKRSESALKESEERFRVAFETSPNSIAIAEIDTGVIVSVNQGFTDFTGYPKEMVIGNSSVNIPIWANPDDRERMVAELRREGEINNLEARFQARSGQIKTGLVSGRVIHLNDQPYLMSVIRDISELRKTRKKLEASQHFLQIVNRHSRMLPMLEEFVNEIQVYSDCRAVGTRILDSQGSMPFAAFTGYSNEFLERENPLSIHDADTMCIRIIRQQTEKDLPYYTRGGSFFTNHSSLLQESAPETKTGWSCSVCSDYGYQSIALIPIQLGSQILGLIHVADPRQGMVPLELVEMLEDAAMQVGAAIQRLRAEEGLRQSNEQLERRVKERTGELAESNRQLTSQVAERKLAETAMRKSQNELRILSSRLLGAEEYERKRIAVELHDGIGQALSAIKFGMENVLRDLAPGAETRSLNTLKALIPLTRQTIEEVRRIVKDLRPSILDDLGILATIGWFCREFETLYTTIRVERKIDLEENDIPHRLKTVIYRILQEAMNNVAKHSQASLVQVGLGVSNATLKMMVKDNGSGFDLDRILSLQSQDRGIGLASMRERAELTGGDFQLVSTPGSGTQIRIHWSAAGSG